MIFSFGRNAPRRGIWGFAGLLSGSGAVCSKVNRLGAHGRIDIAVDAATLGRVRTMAIVDASEAPGLRSAAFRLVDSAGAEVSEKDVRLFWRGDVLFCAKRGGLVFTVR